jgi:hypothetical protein
MMGMRKKKVHFTSEYSIYLSPCPPFFRSVSVSVLRVLGTASYCMHYSYSNFKIYSQWAI